MADALDQRGLPCAVLHDGGCADGSLALCSKLPGNWGSWLALLQEMDQELERYHKSNAQLDLNISDLKLKQEGLKREVLAQRSALEHSHASIKEFHHDVHDVVQSLQVQCSARLQPGRRGQWRPSPCMLLGSAHDARSSECRATPTQGWRPRVAAASTRTRQLLLALARWSRALGHG